MMHILNGNALVAEFPDNPSLAGWLIRNPETHDREKVGGMFLLRWRDPWRLISWPQGRTDG